MSLTMDEHAPVQASWVETSTGIREMASFFGSASERLFGVMHIPPAAPSGGVVVCSPLYAEFARNYRREVLLGRALADRGIAVQRFHYRGSGHSDGQPGAMTFASMLGDAAAAAERLVQETGVRRVAFVATRWAALVAAAAAARYDSPLSLWQPSADSRTYFLEVLRAKQLLEMKGKTADQSSVGTLMDELRRSECLDIAGYPIRLAMFESAEGRTLLEELGTRTRPILLVQMSRSTQLSAGYAVLTAQLEGAGFRVETRIVPGGDGWWFPRHGRDREEDPAADVAALLGATTEWLTHSLVEGS